MCEREERGGKMTILQFMILAVIEYVTLILIMCRVASESYKYHLKPILIYTPIYLAIVSLRLIIFEPISLVATFISVVVFMIIVFNSKIVKALLLSLVATFFFWMILQTLSIVSLGLLFSAPLEFTFDNGLKATTLSLFLAKLCYLRLPLERIVQDLMKTKKYVQYSIVFIIVVKLVYIMLSSVYIGSLYDHTSMLFIYLIATGASSVVVAIFYHPVKLILNLIKKKHSEKNFNFYEYLTAEPSHAFFNFEKHFKIISWLSHMRDDEKTDWYIDTQLDYFYDMENEDLDGVMALDLIELPSKVLAAYLYVKIKHLRSLGIKSAVSNRYLVELLPKNTDIPNLIQALDILIDEAVAATDKERSNLKIILKVSSDYKMAVEIYNNKHLLIAQEAERMLTEAYSLKTRRERDLKKLHAISRRNDWSLSLEEGKKDNEEYLMITYVL